MHSNMLGFFRSLAKIVSKDSTRNAIRHVHVVGTHRIEATDGFRAVRYDLAAPHGLSPGLYDVKRSLLLLRAGQEPAPVEIGGPFPSFDALDGFKPGYNPLLRALRTDGESNRFAREETMDAEHGQRLNAVSLAETAAAVAAIADDGLHAVDVTLGAHNDPALIRADGAHGRATALLMPIRK